VPAPFASTETRVSCGSRWTSLAFSRRAERSWDTSMWPASASRPGTFVYESDDRSRV
jgi:hypothetical protein